jgi:hypothetical protein
LGYVFSSKNNMQDSFTLVCSDFPILHLEMVLAKNARLQSPKVSVEITIFRFGRASKRHKPESLTPTFANSQAAN